ncbi:Pyruvate decarboxylase 4 [Raphanus sativus]|nr:Pyruvate decarboxylase 4 [Raphanus sativus]
MDTKIGSIDACKPTNGDVGSPPSGAVATIHDSAPSVASSEATLGRHLARRLVQAGVTDIFSVPGDFNLTLLDHLIAEPELKNIGCCNELNAGYAADGYARSRGVGACVVTFTVGGLSVLNAIAGAYSENLPVICIVGGPNSNDFGTNRILHHTIGLPDFSQELRCFQTVTCHQAVVNNLEDAHEQIDKAISTALKESKPVYISISCNLAAAPHPTFIRDPVPFSLTPRLSNKMGLEAAVEATLEFLNKAVKPVMVGGVKYEFQMQYGSIGWSVGATLGYAQAVPEKRVLAFIGDGSFQVTAQDVSTMLRNGQKTIIFLINNGGYTIEVEIHDGPYNVIKNWNYTGLVDAIHNGEGKCWTTKVRYEEELVEAIKTATTEKKDSLCFIEVIVHKDDTSKELLEWGSRVAAANGRPPNPQ